MDAQMLDYARAVLDSQDAGQVLRRHLEAIPDIVGADGYGIYVLEPATDAPVEVAAKGVSDGMLENYEALRRHGDPLFNAALLQDGPVHDRMLGLGREWPDYVTMMASHGFSHAMVAPLHYNGQLIGTVNFARRCSSAFEVGDLERTRAVTALAGTAVGHALEFGKMRDRASVTAWAALRSDSLTPRFDGLRGILTLREIEVLEHAAAGMRDQEIADKLFVTIHTVKQHLKNSYGKLGARSRTDAVRLARAAVEARAVS